MEYISKTQKIKISSLHELFHSGDNNISLTKEPSRTNLADLFTKELPREAYETFRDAIGVLPMRG